MIHRALIFETGQNVQVGTKLVYLYNDHTIIVKYDRHMYQFSSTMTPYINTISNWCW